ncbi:GLPGLI family protein [Flavobacterium sp. 14A]|uniref:GLPGLI family protein n=1 Tax=Flavobacterium sp. 14A TaxID=2735896 RepID=UPI00156FE529|nr:GLPGLI family protein [Flavobacterium sp. 14A]NRT13493.1 GLPGLI family protein [Flavobacterium sp. 14A]
MKSILLLAICLFTSGVSFSQNFPKGTLKYEITYDYFFQVNKEDLMGTQTEETVLKIAKDYSIYSSVNNIKLMELTNDLKQSGIMPEREAIPNTRLNYTVTKNFKNNEMMYSEWIKGDTYMYNQTLDKFNWKLEEGQREILGYKCKKATTQFAGRDYIAWYAPGINVTDGPYKFHGLPGLILSLYDTNNYYQFNAINIKNSKSFFDTAIIAAKPIFLSKADYATLKKNYRVKPSSILNTGGIAFPKEFNDRADQRAKERLKYENNPLEIND